MSRTFAVIDAGSNAIRFQLAAVDQPGSYRIVQQARHPVRLGHRVFETGHLDPQCRRDALKVFKLLATTLAEHGADGVRAVATSALREAKDSGRFLEDVAKTGIQLELLSEEDEAQFVALGILSGLSSPPQTGLFVDIGGGSAELAVGNASALAALFNLPLGAVRLTERFPEELEAMTAHIRQELSDVTQRIAQLQFTMAFGSGGTMTCLADLDAATSGEPQQDSLYRLRLSRVQRLFDTLRRQTLEERIASMRGDRKRAEIIVAGAAVLLEIMTLLHLKEIFVSSRGLRDGLMVDLLKRSFPDYPGPWVGGV